MTSKLLASMRALDDQRFLWRVRGAALNVALERYSVAAPEPEYSFAAAIIDNPSAIDNLIPSLVSLVPGIASMITVDAMNGVNTEAVPDELIEAGVRAWFAVAAKRDKERRTGVLNPINTVPSTNQPTTGTEPAPDTAPPTAPTSLTGTAGATTVDLSWEAATDDTGVASYRVSSDNGATWVTNSITETTYQVTGLTPGTSYTFAVAAGDAAGNWSPNAVLALSTTE